MLSLNKYVRRVHYSLTFYDPKSGYAIALELGFMEAITKNCLAATDTTERQKRRCELIIEKICSLPEHNDERVDFEAVLLDIRSLFKSLPSDVGPFRPVEKADKQMDW